MTWFLAGVLFTLLMEGAVLAAVGLDKLETRLNKTGPAEEPRTLGIGEKSGGRASRPRQCADVSSRVGGASTLGRLDAAEPRGDSTASAAPGGSRGPHTDGDTVWPSAASSRPYDRALTEPGDSNELQALAWRQSGREWEPEGDPGLASGSVSVYDWNAA